MNRKIGYDVNARKASLHSQNGKRMELQRGKSPTTEKSRRQRKLASLLQDVDNLKKKLRQEENVHRALERAFTRPLGALPRLPAYLPQYTLELLAEVAVLEEEVVHLEEKIVHFRQGLYQEAVYLSSRKSPLDLTPSRKELLIKTSKQRRHSRSSSHSEINLKSLELRRSPILSRVASTRKFLPENRVSDGLRHCSQSLPNANHHQKDQFLVSENGLGRKKRCSPESGKDKPHPETKSLVVENPVRRDQLKPGIMEKNVNSPKIQYRKVEQSQESSGDRAVDAESEENTISQDILRCLISIFVRLSSFTGKTMDSECFSSLAPKENSENNEESNFRDPYCKFSVFKKRDIGMYKHLLMIEASSVDFNRKENASFLIRRLKLLLDKLASLSLAGLSHHQKLAFWINIYNACIMNAFLEHGIPDSPDMVVLQIQKATMNVGGHFLNALTIEHLILRLPYHLKYTCSKSVKNEGKICGPLGLDWSEPLVTFALSCGSWSSPAVKVYTASGVETELEVAKKEYLQAAVGISSANKLILPKLLDWYLLDFAKDLDSLVDWICLQLPDELRDQALNCLQTRGKEPLSKVVQVMPYDFSFRYLISR